MKLKMLLVTAALLPMMAISSEVSFITASASSYLKAVAFCAGDLPVTAEAERLELKEGEVLINLSKDAFNGNFYPLPQIPSPRIGFGRVCNGKVVKGDFVVKENVSGRPRVKSKSETKELSFDTNRPWTKAKVHRHEVSSSCLAASETDRFNIDQGQANCCRLRNHPILSKLARINFPRQPRQFAKLFNFVSFLIPRGTQVNDKP